MNNCGIMNMDTSPHFLKLPHKHFEITDFIFVHDSQIFQFLVSSKCARGCVLPINCIIRVSYLSRCC